MWVAYLVSLRSLREYEMVEYDSAYCVQEIQQHCLRQVLQIGQCEVATY